MYINGSSSYYQIRTSVSDIIHLYIYIYVRVINSHHPKLRVVPSPFNFFSEHPVLELADFGRTRRLFEFRPVDRGTAVWPWWASSSWSWPTCLGFFEFQSCCAPPWGHPWKNIEKTSMQRLTTLMDVSREWKNVYIHEKTSMSINETSIKPSCNVHEYVVKNVHQKGSHGSAKVFWAMSNLEKKSIH